ncbi:fimbrillin family protein, partial [Phocaeicola vulgatus]
MIMNNNLFKTLFIPAVACLLGACTESTGPDMETSGNSGSIRFGGTAVAGAAIADGDG